jgi:hypothetical protein
MPLPAASIQGKDALTAAEAAPVKKAARNLKEFSAAKKEREAGIPLKGNAGKALSSMAAAQEGASSKNTDIEARLDAAFTGARSNGGADPTPVQAADPAGFLDYAQKLFHPGLEEGGAAVVYRKPGIRPEGAATGEDVANELKICPLTNLEREQAVIRLFERAGADPRDIRTQDAGLGRRNIYVVKKGKTDRVVVVGGHHDKVEGDEGMGVIDNWTGATMTVNLYQALKDVETDATYVFISFAREEEGLIGSKKWVKSLSKEARGKITAMVNLDTLGVDGTYSWKNNSTKTLLKMLLDVARKENRSVEEVNFWGGDADSSSFRDADIPAMTLFGASLDIIFDVIHGAGDSLRVVSIPHYMNAYLLSLALLKRLDSVPAQELRTLPHLAARFARWAASLGS